MKRLRIHMVVDAEIHDNVPTEALTVELVEQVLREEAMRREENEADPEIGRITNIMVMRLEHR